MIVVTPPHKHYSPAHLEHVVCEMRRRGAPRIRAYFDPASGAWFSLEGTHRLRAAIALGLVPIMVPTPWPRDGKSLQRAQFAGVKYGHVFPRVEVAA